MESSETYNAKSSSLGVQNPRAFEKGNEVDFLARSRAHRCDEVTVTLERAVSSKPLPLRSTPFHIFGRFCVVHVAANQAIILPRQWRQPATTAMSSSRGRL